MAEIRITKGESGFTDPVLDNPELVGTGTAHRAGSTMTGTASHFEREGGTRAYCGAELPFSLSPTDWVSCASCMAIARKEDANHAEDEK